MHVHLVWRHALANGSLQAIMQDGSRVAKVVAAVPAMIHNSMAHYHIRVSSGLFCIQCVILMVHGHRGKSSRFEGK